MILMSNCCIRICILLGWFDFFKIVLRCIFRSEFASFFHINVRISFLQRFLNQSNSSFTDQKKVVCATSFSDFEVAFTIKVKIDGLPIPKGSLIKGPYKPICRDLYHLFFDYWRFGCHFQRSKAGEWDGRWVSFTSCWVPVFFPEGMDYLFVTPPDGHTTLEASELKHECCIDVSFYHLQIATCCFKKKASKTFDHQEP